MLTALLYDDGDWDGVLDLVDRGSPYALTGAVLATDRARGRSRPSDRLRNAAGNFYVNDKPTGAVVGQQPFGGARASRHERQGRLALEPRALDEPARDQGDVRAADRVALPAHGLRAGRRPPATGGWDSGSLRPRGGRQAAGQRTFGFQSSSTPRGLCFQIQACSE